MPARAVVNRLTQRTETPLQIHRDGMLGWRYLYARAADSQTADEPGQDYLSYQHDSAKFVFALCDGVGQSFFGDLAARLLGDRLVEWLWDEVPTGLDEREVHLGLSQALVQLIGIATQQVQAHRMPDNLPPLVEDVLNEKRTHGSESTFVCGRIDLPGGDGDRGRVLLAWMGDSRLRLWDGSGERTTVFGRTFRTAERWSTRRGPVRGEPHVFVTPLHARDGQLHVSRLMAYSDGLSVLDELQSPSDEELVVLVAQSAKKPWSDDVSFIEVRVLDPTSTDSLNESSRVAAPETVQPPARPLRPDSPTRNSPGSGPSRTRMAGVALGIVAVVIGFAIVGLLLWLLTQGHT
jgi:hypothetical protein